MLNERTKILSMTILITLEDAMQIWIPQQQVGFMKGRQIISHITRVYQRIQDTQWGGERWFMGVDLEKAFNRVSHEFLVVAMRQAGIPEDIVC